MNAPSKKWSPLIVSALAIALAMPACGSGSNTNDRWVATQNSAVDIDWDAIGKAYQEAEGPEDFEQKVNEIYTGDEVISVSVRDEDAKTQIVTGFFDKDNNGQVADAEKIFELRRDIVDESNAQMQFQGYGPYHSYHSPMWNIATGMMMGHMLSRAFSPSYAPMYRQPYTTSVARQQSLTTHRNSYRQANPTRFQQKSKSGRTYNRGGKSFGGGKAAPSRSFGGSRAGRSFGGRSSQIAASVIVLE